MGYDPGPLDGVYGYLTYAAVRDFQRDYRLPADGVAGRRVRAVLYDERLTARREWIIVAEPRADFNRMMALRTMMRQIDILSAVSVLVEVLHGADDTTGLDEGTAVPAEVTSTPADVTVNADRCLPSTSDDMFAIPDDGLFDGLFDAREAAGAHLSSWATLHCQRGAVIGDYEPGALQRMLHSRRGRKRLNDLIDDSLDNPRVDVLHLQLGDVRWGDGARFLGVVRRAAGRAAVHGKELVVSLPLRNLNDAWTRLANDIDYGALGAIASRIVLVPPVRAGRGESPRPPSPSELAALVRAVVRRVPPWRCLLAVPMGALVLPAQRQRPPAIMSYQRAMAMAYGSRTRPQWDDAAGRSSFPGRLDDEDVTVWLETTASFTQKLDIVRQARLAGVYLTSVGDEDVRLWRGLRERLPKPDSPES